MFDELLGVFNDFVGWDLMGWNLTPILLNHVSENNVMLVHKKEQCSVLITWLKYIGINH